MKTKKESEYAMYLNNDNKYLCSGCTACKAVCPVDAIEMVRDEEGFKYPKINKEKCIDCNLCKNVCPNVKKSSENEMIEAHGAKLKDLEGRKTSRSGGAFIAISDYILNQNGIIYGSVLNRDFSVSHSRATNKEERDLFKGSKYVQSDMNDTIKQVIEDLKNGHKVLFSGTPCQVGGVIAAVPKKLQDNLFTIDILCHGVPSNMVYEEFLKYIEEKENKKIKEFIFRDKSFGWSTHYETFIFEDNSKITTEFFRNLFYGHNVLRPSCFKCNYANVNRPADITIADFWGVDEIAPEFHDETGVSLAIINSEKGKEIFENVKDDYDTAPCSLENCIKYAYTLRHPTEEPEEREEFWNDYSEKEFKDIIEKYATR